MDWVKQNWIKISLGIFVLLVLFFLLGAKDTQKNTAMIGDVVQTPTPTTAVSKTDPRIQALEQSLPRFEDYPVRVYSIPPKPIINHQSNPYGMRFWTFIENMASTSETWNEQGRRWSSRTKYDMAGHYLADRCCTGNPNLLIVDGLTGKIFYEYGGIGYEMRPNSSLVIFEPFELECFTQSGDYECPYDGISGGGNPRYAKWDGKQFVTICEPIVKNWKVISCGKAADKTSGLYGKRKVSWMGTVVATMTYGRLRIKSLDGQGGNVFSTDGLSFRSSDNLDTAQYGYSEFVAEPYDVDDTPYRESEITSDIKIGDLVQITGYWENTTNGIPWVLIERIQTYE